MLEGWCELEFPWPFIWFLLSDLSCPFCAYLVNECGQAAMCLYILGPAKSLIGPFISVSSD